METYRIKYWRFSPKNQGHSDNQIPFYAVRILAPGEKIAAIWAYCFAPKNSSHIRMWDEDSKKILDTSTHGLRTYISEIYTPPKDVVIKKSEFYAGFNHI